MRRRVTLAALGIVAAAAGCRPEPAPSQPATPVVAAPAAPVAPAAALPPQTAVSLWLGGETGDAWCAVNADVSRPTASAVKAFFLVELFAAHAGALDKPLPGADKILDDADHPALSHFNKTPGLRDAIKKGLGGATTVRRIGEIMIGTAVVGSGDATSGYIYNAAANLTTAALGGPDALTALIHKRDAAFVEVRVRRYMLRDRKTPGDNEAPATAFVALYRRLATRAMPGLDAATTDAVRAALRQPPDGDPGTHFGKGGSLPSDPLTQVRAGWRETAKGSFVYVVMLAEPLPGAPDPTANARLNATADNFRKMLALTGAAVRK